MKKINLNLNFKCLTIITLLASSCGQALPYYEEETQVESTNWLIQPSENQEHDNNHDDDNQKEETKPDSKNEQVKEPTKNENKPVQQIEKSNPTSTTNTKGTFDISASKQAAQVFNANRVEDVSFNLNTVAQTKLGTTFFKVANIFKDEVYNSMFGLTSLKISYMGGDVDDQLVFNPNYVIGLLPIISLKSSHIARGNCQSVSHCLRDEIEMFQAHDDDNYVTDTFFLKDKDSDKRIPEYFVVEIDRSKGEAHEVGIGPIFINFNEVELTDIDTTRDSENAKSSGFKVTKEQEKTMLNSLKDAVMNRAQGDHDEVIENFKSIKKQYNPISVIKTNGIDKTETYTLNTAPEIYRNAVTMNITNHSVNLLNDTYVPEILTQTKYIVYELHNAKVEKSRQKVETYKKLLAAKAAAKKNDNGDKE